LINYDETASLEHQNQFPIEVFYFVRGNKSPKQLTKFGIAWIFAVLEKQIDEKGWNDHNVNNQHDHNYWQITHPDIIKAILRWILP
jgi:hypothetical protein